MEFPVRILDELRDIFDCCSAIEHLIQKGDFQCVALKTQIATLMRLTVTEKIEDILKNNQ